MDWIIEVDKNHEDLGYIAPACAFNCGREIPPSPPCPEAFCLVKFGGEPCSSRGCGILVN